MDYYCRNDSTTSKTISVKELEPGMYLDEDIVNRNGALLVPQGVILDNATISRIKTFSEILRNGSSLKVIY